jgi:CheY-like chemotaxis protein
MGTFAERKRILIVEDDRGLQDVLAAKLESHELYQVLSREGAYRELAGRVFDLVLLDLRLPLGAQPKPLVDTAGFDVLARLRADPRHRDTAVVVMTAHEVTSETTKRALKAGATDYWNKNGTYSESLFDLLARVLREQDQQRAQAAQAGGECRHRLDFCATRQEARLEGGVVFRKASYQLLTALRGPFVEALSQGRLPRFVPSTELAGKLGLDESHVRKTVARIRSRAQALLPSPADRVGAGSELIESQQWDGYRLNPDRVQVADVAAVQEQAP